MSNSGKVWDTREAYQNQRANTWETPGNRGMRLGGQTTPAGSESNTVEFVDMISTGNTADFGDLTQARKKGAGAGGFTRILCLGGQTPTNVKTIDFVNPVATGNFSDFGDLVNAGQTTNVSHCNNIKTISADGSGDADGVVITHMASQGNSSSFQNRTNIDTQWAVGTGDNTRFLMAGRYPASNQIDSMEIATTGTKFDFGNLTRSGWGIGAVSNSTRSVFFGGYNPSATNIIEFVTTQSAGNATDFGDLTSTDFIDAAGSSNSKKGITWGYQTNKIDIFNIATTGNATDFGDTLTSTFYQIMGADNGGGGLPQEGAFPQRLSVTYMPGSGKVLMTGGNRSGGDRKLIDSFQISTLGNASSFGDLIGIIDKQSGCASTTRMFSMGGETSGTAYMDRVEAINFQSEGNSSDFNNLVAGGYLGAGCNSTTRAIYANPRVSGGTPSNRIDYFEMSSTGNASDFGNATVTMYQRAALSNSTRGVIGGGDDDSSQSDVMDYITIASTGDATDFGDLSQTDAIYGLAALSNSTRGIFGGGRDVSPGNAATNIMQYITIASTGNTTDFGDLSQAREQGNGASTPTRGTFIGGRTPSIVSTIDFITIASTGNATDFGDMTEGSTSFGCASDSNGGLQSS